MSKSARTLRRAAGVLAVAAMACLAGCGGENFITPPNEVVQNYLNALAAGYYPKACGLLDNRTREAQVRRAGPRATCEKLFARCLPHTVTRLSHDPLQLYYSNVEMSGSGGDTSAAVSGTEVARAIRHVTLADERGTWKLTSYGSAVDQCDLARALRPGKASAHRARKASAHRAGKASTHSAGKA